jgi:hypothetical protein
VSAINVGNIKICIGSAAIGRLTIAALLFLLLAPLTPSYAGDQSPVGREIRSTEATQPDPPATDVTADPSNETDGEKRTPDWDGIRRDSGIIVGSQFAVTGVLFLMPESVSSWSIEQKQNSSKKFASNFVHPVIDKDKFYINYILHPYWGAAYYTRARERGLDPTQSLVYSALLSAIYEFGVECIFEKPSIQDLIVTPGIGSLLGAFVFEPWRNSIKRKPELQWYDHAVLIVTDPIGILSDGFEKIFDIKPAITVDYSQEKRLAQSTVPSHSNRFDLVLTFPLN